MSELLITQCPHCQTRFRLTPAQLGVAAGHVRCGACLEVFHAADAAPAARTAAVSAQQQSSLVQDDLDEPDLAALGLDESIIDEVNPVGMTDPAPAAPLFDLHEDFLATPPAQDFGPDFDHQRLGLEQPQVVEESYTDQGIFQRDHPAALPDAPPPAIDDATISEQHHQQPDVPAPTEPEDDHPQSATTLQLDMLEQELLDATRRPRRPPSWLWTSLAMVALLALPIQYLFYNFDALARDQRSRPLLENICLLARCELPARVDISRIRSTNLLVRPHPEFPNALAIDVILYNRADFEQPFPVLEMQFTDAAGQPLAHRRFRPEEYLAGELAGVNLMPSQTPIHVGLSMLDPGSQARSYRLEFLSP